jgi:hypothetical protein
MLSWREGESVMPEMVEILIRRMLRAGWDPDERGIAFRGVGSGALRNVRTKMSVVREVMES